jgi:hypothetical protein
MSFSVGGRGPPVSFAFWQPRFRPAGGAAGGQGPGARLFSEQAAANECGMKNLASHQAKRSAAAALPAADRRSKSKGQKTKAARWCIKSCLTSAGVAARGFLFHPRPRRTPHLLPHHRHWLRQWRKPSLSESGTSGQPIRTPAFLAKTPNSPRISRACENFLCCYQDHNLGCPGLTRCGANPFTKSLPGVALNFVPASRKAGS